MSVDGGYRIKTVSEMTGIPRNTLIAWERRHGFLSPVRLANGYRLYSEEDVSLLRRLKDAVSSGVAISAALLALKAEGAAPAGSGAARISASDLGAARDELFAALMQFDGQRAGELLARLEHVPYASMIDEVYVPLLHHVGDEWERGAVTVAQEHFAAAFVREKLVAMLLRLRADNAHGERVACVTFPGERHELALLALSVHLALRGCHITYLGADVPLPDLVDFLGRTKLDCLCVSVIVQIDEAALARFSRAARRAAPPETRIVIGGTGLPPGRRRPVAGVELLGDWHELALPRKR